MAYAPQSNDMKGSPPPYSANNEMPQSYQPPPPSHPAFYVAPPPPPVITYAPTATYIQPLGGFLSHAPQALQCPTCRQQIITVVRYEPGGGTWLIALIIFLFGGFLGCCLIPFCVTSMQDAVHTCPSCRALIGRRNAF